MQAPASNAIQNNQRLFGPFSRKLASDDPASYSAFSEKFAVWLSDERAYYLEARPEILRILKIAQSTLRRNVGANPDLKAPFHISSYIDHPMVASYSRLLRAIHPYRDRFVEPDLQAEVRALLKTITAPIRIASVDLTTEPYSSIPGIAPPPKYNESISRQPSVPTPVSVLQTRPSSLAPSSHAQTAPGRPDVVRAHPQTSLLDSMPAANGKTTTHVPIVTDNSVVTQNTTDPSLPAAVSVLPQNATAVPAPSGRLVSSKGFERNTSEVSTQIQHTTQTTSFPSKQIKSPTPHPTPVITPSEELSARSKTKKKKKKKLDFGLESLIRADLQELRKRGVTVKQESTEPANLLGCLDAPSTQVLTAEGASNAIESIPPTRNINHALPEMATRPQPEVIVLDHDDVDGSTDLGAPSTREVDSDMAVDGQVGHSSFAAIPSSNKSMAIATSILEMEHNENDMIIDETGHTPTPSYNKGPAFGHTSREDVSMSDDTALGSLAPITKANTQPDKRQLHVAQLASLPLPRINGVPQTNTSITIHEAAHKIIQAPSSNLAIYHPALAVSHAAPNSPVIVETDNVQPVPALPQETQRDGHGIMPPMAKPDVTLEMKEGVIQGTASAYASQEMSPHFDTEISDPSDNQTTIQRNNTIPVASSASSETVSSHPIQPFFVHDDGLLPETQPSLPSNLDSSLNAMIVSSGEGTTLFPATSVILHPTSSTITRPTLVSNVDDLSTPHPRKALEPVMMNDIPSVVSEPSDKPSLQPGPTPPAQISTRSVEYQVVSENDRIPLTSMPEVAVYPAEELKALYAFGPGTVTFAIHKGLIRKSRATIQFDILEEQFHRLTLWRNRKDHTNDLKESLCVSLACYSRVSVKTETKTLEEVGKLPSMWPSNGGLTMNVMYKDKRTNFPLSPPFFVAPNGLVDVSDFLHVGSNTIELDQFADMSAYIFILRVHHPTGAQLQQVAQRRQKNQAWKDWLHKMSQPLDLPIPSFA